jgi:hypothetical protein
LRVPGHAGKEDSLGAATLRFRQRSVYERRGTAGCDAQDNIFGRDLALSDRFDGIVGMVFSAFDASPDRLIPAGDDALHHFRRSHECRGALSGIDNAQPPGSPRAHIEESPTALERPHDAPNRLTNLRLGPFDGVGHSAILAVDDIERLTDVHTIDVHRPLVLLFG